MNYSVLQVFLLLLAAVVVVAVASDADKQTVEWHGWLAVGSKQLKVQSGSFAGSMMMATTNFTIKAVNCTNFNGKYFSLTMQDSILFHDSKPAATGSTFTFNVTVPLEEHLSVIDIYSPCKADFFKAPPSFYFYFLTSFLGNPPPTCYLLVDYVATIAPTTTTFYPKAQQPVSLPTTLIAIDQNTSVSTTPIYVHLKGRPGAPLINERFTELHSDTNCKRDFSVLLKWVNTTYFFQQLQVKTGYRLVTLDAINSGSYSPSPTPDYDLYFTLGPGDGGDGGDDDDDDDGLKWYWILLIVAGGLLGCVTVAGLAGLVYYVRTRSPGYDQL